MCNVLTYYLFSYQNFNLIGDSHKKDSFNLEDNISYSQNTFGFKEQPNNNFNNNCSNFNNYNNYNNQINPITNNPSYYMQQFNQNHNYMFNNVNVIQPIIHPNTYNQIPLFSNHSDYNNLGNDGPFSRNVVKNSSNRRDQRDQREQKDYYTKHPINNSKFNNNDSSNQEQSMVGDLSILSLRDNHKTNERTDFKIVQNYQEMTNDELARHCYVLAKDQGGCRFLQKKAEESKEFANDYLFPNVILITYDYN